jgi:hypothetical protein
MRMDARFWIATGLLACVTLLPAAQSRASVSYDFNSTFNNALVYSFQYISPNFITIDTDIPKSDLLAYFPSNISSIDFDPVSCSFGSTPCDWLFVNYSAGGGTGSAAYYFPNNALSADGIYNTIAGNVGVLTVSGSPDTSSVPEPSSIVPLLAGLLGLGAFRFRIGLLGHRFSFGAGWRSTTSIDVISSGSPR